MVAVIETESLSLIERLSTREYWWESGDSYKVYRGVDRVTRAARDREGKREGSTRFPRRLH